MQRKLLFSLIIFSLTVCFINSSHARLNSIISTLEQKKIDKMVGEKLVRNLWQDIQKNNIKKLSNKISKEFQATANNKNLDKKQQLNFLKKIELKDYNIKEVKTTGSDHLLLVSYKIKIKGLVKNKDIAGESYYVLSIFKKKGDNWKWLANSDLVNI